LLTNVVTRSERISFAVVGLVVFLAQQGNVYKWYDELLAIFVSLLLVVLLARFGFLALFVCSTTLFVVGAGAITANPGQWYFARSCFVLAITLAIAVYGFRAALAGRSPFGGEVGGG